MKPPIRVLLVDDSVVVRTSVTAMLESDPGIEVVGTAPNGRIALDKLGRLAPDLVILDVEMPEMGGFETLRRIRMIAPRLPILMFSAHTERGAALTLDALAQGASDYVTKPSSLSGVASSAAHVRDELIAKTHALAGGARGVGNKAVTSTTAVRPLDAAIEVVVIAASTGGPNAVSEIFTRLSPSFAVPVLIVQHMPPMFTRLFAERLAQLSGLDVREGVERAVVAPGQAWVAPGDFHMEVRREGCERRIAIHQGPLESSCRPAADVLFRSAAAAYGPGVLAVVLTGMGQDGLRGCEDVRRAGGQVIVQDQATSVVGSMPGAVAAAGLAERELPIEDIGLEVLRRVQRGVERIAAQRATTSG